MATESRKKMNKQKENTYSVLAVGISLDQFPYK